jgi:acyl-CoA thioesterase FadM
MYPFVRMAKELFIHRNAEPLPVTGTHVSHHMCWPWDLDFWMELNNGRTLTLFDLGRIPMVRRIGLNRVVRENGWGMTVAGVSIRYRRRIRIFEGLEMRTRALGWDGRFLYLDQTLWNKQGDCTSHALYRMAVTSADGMVPPDQVMRGLGVNGPSPVMPDWVQAWIKADATRPWPPEKD